MTRYLFSLLALALLSGSAAAQQRPAAPGTDISAATAGMERLDGFIPVILDGEQGRILLELPRDSLRALALFTLATGLGSNPIGLDRGANGPEYVVRFDRAGQRVNVVFENWGYRTSSADPDHARSIAEAFPPSTVAALNLVAAQGGRLLVDATDFLLRDWTGVAEALQTTDQGSYSVSRDRSAVYRPRTRGFPGNTEIDVALTFTTSGRPGRIVRQIVPDGSAFTLRQHLSLVPLPDAAYRPRELDPRAGFFGISFKDYARPIQEPLDRRWISRFRLMRANPADPRSAITNPIVYYVDRGIPEPIRSATVEGARFWEEAFTRAGLPGGFRVELLPEGADPMDVRYNVVQWENRNERGWSIGGSMGDPRTGEILKAMARMDSHRARTDYNIYAALMGADAAAADTAFVLGRVRQVTAHEIGHTLGMAHNYIASTYERGSVMDYPPPRVRLDASGNIDISAAYARGPGAFDVWAIRWAYGIFPENAERDSLRAIIAEGLRNGWLFLSDADARPDFASDPRTNLWDDAANPADFLRHQMDVRRVAMSRFGLRNIRAGEPVALLQERFSFVYFWHRFAAASLAKAIGGMEYQHAVAGDGQQATRWVPAAAQRRALSRLLDALEPAELRIPDTVLTLLGPRPFAWGGAPELFGSRTAPAFDELGAAQSLADALAGPILQLGRAARLMLQSARNPSALSLGETIDSLAARTFRSDANARSAALRRAASRAVADRLLRLAADTSAAPEARAMAELKLRQLSARARVLARTGAAAARAHWLLIAGDFDRWLARQELPKPSPALRLPQYDPFGEP
jgi:hypothetical protein